MKYIHQIRPFPSSGHFKTADKSNSIALKEYIQFFLILTCIATNGCKAERTHDKNIALYQLVPENEEVITKLIYDSEAGGYLHFNSRGGKTSTSLKISDLISTRNLSIFVDRVCSSNCAEIILPSANNIYFENEPLIGFHGNIISYRHFVENQTEVDGRFCNWFYAKEVEKLYELKKLNIDFWEDQMVRLKPSIFLLERSGECPYIVYNFENDIWLPTSEQLKELWGLKFVGSVCADSIKSCKTKVNLHWPEGKRIIIGDSL